MRLTPIKIATGAALTLGVLLAGASWLHSQGNQAPESGEASGELGAVRGDLSAMETGRGEVGKLYEEAKKQKDIIRTSCIHEKLVRLTNIIALAREQFSRFLMEKAAGGTGSAIPLRQKVSLFKERADEMVQEARQCAGEAIKVTDKPEVVETVDPKIPQDDPTEPVGSIWIMQRPPEASPYF